MPNFEKKIAIGFIVYRPEASFFERLEEVDKAQITTFIFDNSPELAVTKDFVRRLSSAHYFSSGRNAGLGVGLYEICRSAYQENFETLLFFDQDTKFNLETFSFIRDVYTEKSVDLMLNYTAICFSGSSNKNHNSPVDISYEDVDLTINSGSLFLLKNLEKIGWHNSSYFVDGVDYEFCLRSHIYGFRVGRFFNTPHFDHETEQPDTIVSIFGKRLLIRKYSFARMRDGISSYIRLIYSSAKNGQFKYALIFCRSFSIYIFGQVLARILG